MVTHDPEEAMFMADRIALMRAGRIVQLGTPANLYYQPSEAFVASFFGEINSLEGRSEEHTSELQSLMRISYAVFCLKKKKYNNHQNTHAKHNIQLIHQRNTTQTCVTQQNN